MADSVVSIVEIFQLYSGSSLYMAAGLAALFYLWMTEENKGVRSVLIYVATAILGLFLIPFYAYFIINYILEYEVYYRMLWLVPFALLFAYASVKLLIHLKERKRQIAVTILLAAALISGGKCVFAGGTYEKAENAYHVPQTAVEIAEQLQNVDFQIVAAVPAELVQFMRQIDPSITLCYGREILVDRWGFQNELYEEIQKPVLDADAIQSYARRQECTCIIVDNNKEMIGNLEDSYYNLFATVDHYDIYVTSLE